LRFMPMNENGDILYHRLAWRVRRFHLFCVSSA